MADSQIAASTRRRCVFVTVLWGDWHRNIFLDANLPTMLSPGNLPALAAGIDCEYLVYTTSKDALQMTRNRAFQQLRSIVPLSLRLFMPSRTKISSACNTRSGGRQPSMRGGVARSSS